MLNKVSLLFMYSATEFDGYRHRLSEKKSVDTNLEHSSAT